METILSGEFESTVDPKGRFLMPALLKKQLPQNELEDLWLNRSIHGLKCLVLFLFYKIPDQAFAKEHYTQNKN